MQHPAALAGRQNVKIILLSLLYEKGRGGLVADDVSAPPDFLARYRLSFGNEDKIGAEIREIFRHTLSDLRYEGFLAVEPLPAGQGLVRIRPNGIRELGRLRPSITYDERDKLGGTLLDQSADLQETIDDTRQEEARLALGITAFDSKITALRDHVDKRVSDVDSKIAQMQKHLYNQVLVLMSVFVAAFALILTSAQVVQTTTRSTTGGGFQTLLASSAVMVPVTSAVVILVIVARRLTRPRSPR